MYAIGFKSLKYRLLGVIFFYRTWTLMMDDFSPTSHGIFVRILKKL